LSQKRWWPIISTVLFAHLLAVVVIGLGEFAFTSSSESMNCIPSSPRWDSLCDWLRSGRRRPLSDFFTAFDIKRFNATIAGIVLLGMGLGWSIWLMRPLRVTIRFRLRTLMAVIALVPLEVTAGADVWNRWRRWDADQRIAPQHALSESLRQEIELQIGDSISVEVHDPLPGTPLHGDRIVRADGKIDLDRYGPVYVSGLTASETKEKIISRLQKHLLDRSLVPIAASELRSRITVPTNRN
jgi:Polysaccharide biosynthesis/export protein